MSQKPKSTRSGHLTVRMYDVSFGDCFLLKIPKGAGKYYKVLFDCGTHNSKKDAEKMKGVMQQLIEDVQDRDGKPRIDVVVATHMHQDHISGFADPAWDAVEVGEVWLPWIENPQSKEAQQLRDQFDMVAKQLVKRFDLAPESVSRTDAFLLLKAMAVNAERNEAALRRLKQEFGSPERVYLPEKENGAIITRFHPRTMPDVTVHVLGPSREKKVICSLDPPACEHYANMDFGSEEPGRPRPPFPARWRIKPEAYGTKYPVLNGKLPEEDRKAVQKAGYGLDEAFAMKLDEVLNGTSLVLIFQIGSATLLFPGDAEWGTWKMALGYQKPNIFKPTEFSKLLEEVTFYKVGHHGSYNATPKRLVELMATNGKKAWAMISVTQMSQWKNIPKKELVDALRTKGFQIALSNSPQEAPQPWFKVSNGVVEARIPY